MPGEFHWHGGGTWMVWPERLGTWRLDCGPAREAFAEVAKAISRFETVSICVSSDQYASARALLPLNIRLIEMSSNDSWARDIGPTFVQNPQTGEVRGVDWTFNAWGGLFDGLYKDWALDDLVAGKICQIERLKSYRLESFVLEGGSIHVDGEGTCITTEACLLSAGRNPTLSKPEIEEMLRAYLGVRCIIWLPRGIHLDDTNEHVDNIVHFIGPAQVVLAWTDDQSDPQYALSAAALAVLEGAEDAQGRRFSITKVHTPGPLYVTAEEGASFGACDPICKAGDRLPASYANFYLCNGGCIVPTFGDPARDAAALETLRSIMPDRQVVGVYSREILLGGGNIHCITQQQP
jgi:agmatine deiminase